MISRDLRGSQLVEGTGIAERGHADATHRFPTGDGWLSGPLMDASVRKNYPIQNSEPPGSPSPFDRRNRGHTQFAFAVTRQIKILASSGGVGPCRVVSVGVACHVCSSTQRNVRWRPCADAFNVHRADLFVSEIHSDDGASTALDHTSVILVGCGSLRSETPSGKRFDGRLHRRYP